MIGMMWKEVRENLKRAVLWMIALVVGVAFAMIDPEWESECGRPFGALLLPASWCSRRLEQALDAFLSEALVLNFTPNEIRQVLDRRLAEIAVGQPARRGQRDE